MIDRGEAMDVIFQNRVVARLIKGLSGGGSLRYVPEMVRGLPDRYLISVSLPVREKSWTEDQSRPFLAGLLPEGRVRDALVRRLQIADSDDFGLLSAIGAECAGALSFIPQARSEDFLAGRLAGVDWKTDTEVAAMIADLPAHPLLFDEAGEIRISLAGVQEKTAAVIDGDGRVGLPRGGTPSTHILKPPVLGADGRPAYPGIVENEAFCLLLAQAVGLAAAEVSIRHIGDNNVLVVERYDRELDEQGIAHRVHQEDLCQAMGIPPGRKYEHDGGPGAVDTVRLLRYVSRQPAADIPDFLDRLAFGLLVGNCDAHGKNTALLLEPAGIRLAPSYDVVSTVVYPIMSKNLAMRISNQYQADQVTPRHWLELLRLCDIDSAAQRQRLADFAVRLLDSVSATKQKLVGMGFDHDVLAAIERNALARSTAFTRLPAYAAQQRRDRQRRSVMDEEIRCEGVLDDGTVCNRLLWDQTSRERRQGWCCYGRGR